MSRSREPGYASLLPVVMPVGSRLPTSFDLSLHECASDCPPGGHRAMTEQPKTQAGLDFLKKPPSWIAPGVHQRNTLRYRFFRDLILAIEAESFMDGARASRENRAKLEAAAAPAARRGGARTFTDAEVEAAGPSPDIDIPIEPPRGVTPACSGCEAIYGR